MEEELDILKQHFGKYYQGYLIATAMLEDYARVVAKLEGVDEKEVKDRIKNRAKEMAREAAKDLPKPE